MRSLVFLLAGLCAVLPFLRAADEPAGNFLAGDTEAPPSRLTVRADHTAIAPGAKFNLLFDFSAKPGWHAYWQNPGAATGLPIKPEWKLPPGFTVGELEQPDPHRLKFGTQDAFYGYEGRFPLAATLTAPADLKPGSKVTLAVDFTWLVCDEGSCLPGEAKFSLILDVAPISAPVPEVAKQLADFRAARAQPPGNAWKISGRSDGKNAVLTLVPGPGAVSELKGARYLSADPTVFAEPPETLAKNADGSYTLTAPLDVDGVDKFKGINGLLFADSGWLTTRPSKFIAIPEGGEIVIETPPLDFGIIAFALLGGLILNIMPCVFPVIGIKVLGFVEQAGSSKRKVLAHGLSFTAGVLVAFWVLAGALLALKGGVTALGIEGDSSINWGYQLQNPYVVYVLAAFLLVFALNLSGLFEIGQSLTGVGQNAQSQSGLKGSFMSGLLATVVATPCSAPFLGTALSAALQMTPLNSMILFTFIGIGLSLPYLLLAAFPQLVDRLPRPGAWMETFKKLMAFPIYGTVAYLVGVLAGIMDDNLGAYLYTIVSFSVLALAAFVYGNWCAPHKPASTRRKGIAATVLIAALALYAGWPRLDNLWTDWSREIQEDKRLQTPVYVDFTALWCVTCQSNKSVAYSDEVKRVAEQKGILFLKADITKPKPPVQSELKRLGKAAIPVNVLYVPGSDKPIVFDNILTPGALLEEFNKLPDAKR